MALNLDRRQRAMLKEMGITVWLPSPPPAPRTAAHTAVPVREHAAPPAAAPRPPVVPRPAPAAQAAHTAQAAPTTPAAPPATTLAPPGVASATTGWRLHPAKRVYAPAAAAHADGGWLILLEHPVAHGLPPHPAGGAEPVAIDTALEGDAARLLDNMLRALRLHQQPHIWSASLERDASDHPALDSSLDAMVRELRPARILVLGLAAARAVLGRSDALGRLRAEPHQVAGVPAVVTYDPSYLLRAPHAKPAAWADLCRAQSLAFPAPR